VISPKAPKAPNAASARVAFALALAAGAVLLTGCDVGQPSGFTARSEYFCHQTSTQIGDLSTPTTPKAQLQYATDRYTLLERLVSELTDSSLPGSSTGTELRERWLQPARVSLVGGRGVLVALRAAANTGDSAAAGAAFARSLAIGTGAVDTALLRDHGLNDCAQVFAPTAVRE
jgi:hypothetical protein